MTSAAHRTDRLVRRVLNAGWLAVALSAVFLAISGWANLGDSALGEWGWAISLMLARLLGMSSFAIGGVAIYNHRWTEGVLIMLASVVLPIVAFVVHGTI